MKILINYKIPVEPFAGLEKGSYRLPEKEQFDKEELIAIIPEYDALISVFTYTVDKDIIDAGKNLKIISNYGVGYNNVDIKYARAKGITVTNTPLSVCFPTAEMAMGLMLSTARRIAECDRRIRTEKESMWGTMKNLGRTLEGRTLGIIGMGNIGKTVATMAQGFRMRIIYNNRSSIVEGYERVSFEELLRQSDYISLHTPLTDSTRKMIGVRELAMMKPTAILINTSRGAVVDEQALLHALQTGVIAGAGLDVFENEPHITEGLYGLDNVVLTPHDASGTVDTRIATGVEALENIKNFFNGNPTNVVN